MFILEDGTGKNEANAYVDAAYVEGYLMGDRLAQFRALTPEQQEAAIIRASQLVDLFYEWKGSRKTLEQGLGWPRSGVTFDGFAITDVPAAVKKAVCEAVWLAMTEKNLYRTDDKGIITSEKVDNLAVTYGEARKDTVTRYEILDKLLRGLYRTETKSSGSSVGSCRVERV